MSLLFKFKLIAKLIRSALQTNQIGDIPLLKAEIFGLVPSRNFALQNLVKDGREIDTETLLYFPMDTFGCDYASFLKARNIKPIQFDRTLEIIANKHPFICRQFVVHDFLHVVLHFDTTYAGEMGVFAFLVGQNNTSWQKYFFALALIVYPLLSPLEVRQIFLNAKMGYQMGRRAVSVIEFPFESNFQLTTDQVRRKILDASE